MKQFKKLIACVLAATLVLGSTTVVFGAENSQTGSLGGGADLEGVVNREVFSVEAPTVAYLPDATGSVYNFILDPEGLIEETEEGNYAGADFVTYGSMYFQTGATEYNVKSQEATVTNKSSVDVTVTLNATVTVPASNAAVTFDADGVWAATDTSLGIYLAIEGKDVNNDYVTGAAIVANGGAVTTDLASYGAYKVIATNDGYEYAIDPDLEDSATADTYTFWLTGACNTNADWSGYDTTANPSIELVWTVEVKGAEGEAGTESGDQGVSVPTVSATSIKNNGGSVNITCPDGVTITQIQKVKKDGTFNELPDTYYTLTSITGGQKLTLKDVFEQYPVATKIKVIFSEGDPIELTVTE